MTTAPDGPPRADVAVAHHRRLKWLVLALFLLLAILAFLWNLFNPTTATDIEPLTGTVSTLQPLDLQPPEIPLSVELPPLPITPGEVLLSGQGAPNSILELTLDGGSVGTTQIDATGAWSYSLTVPESGQYSLSAHNLTADGAVIAQLPAVELIVSALVATNSLVEILQIDLPQGQQTVGSIALSGMGLPDSRIELFLGETSIGATTVDDVGNWSYNYLALSAGDHLLSADMFGADGQLLASSADYPLSITTIGATGLAPTVELPASNNLSLGTYELRGKGLPGTTVELLINEESSDLAPVADNGTWQYSLSLSEPGEYAIVASTLDKGGRIVAAAPEITFTVGSTATVSTTVSTSISTTVSSATASSTSVEIAASQPISASVAATGAATDTVALDESTDSRIADSTTSSAAAVGAIDASMALTDTTEAEGSEAESSERPTVASEEESASAPNIVEASQTSTQTVAINTAESSAAAAESSEALTTALGISATFGLSATIGLTTTEAVENTLPKSEETVQELAAATPEIILPEGDITPGLVALRGTGAPETTIELLLDGESGGLMSVDSAGRWAYFVSLPEPGAYTLNAHNLDENNALLSSQEISLTVVGPLTEDVAPNSTQELTVATSDSQPVINRPTGALEAGQIELSGTGAPLSTIKLLLDDNVAAIGPVDQNGLWASTLTLREPRSYTILAQALDANGDLFATSESVEINILPSTPQGADEIPTVSLTNTARTAGEIALGGTAIANANLEILVDGELVGRATATIAGTWSFVAQIDAGDHQITINALDNVGSILATSPVLQIRLTEPAVEEPNIAPANAPANAPSTGPDDGCAHGVDLGQTWQVGACDTLWYISQQTNISVPELLAANPSITNVSIIYLEQQIALPGR